MKTQQDEQAMVSAIRSGDRVAFTQLIRAYERLVLHIVSPLVGNEHDRADVCQEVFIKVYQQLHSFQFKARLSTWIGHIAYNTAINFLRKRKSLLLDDIFGPGDKDEDGQNTYSSSTELSDNYMQPDALLMQKQGNEILNQAIDTLPVIQKAMLRLFHTDELALEEISIIIEMPVNTVKSHLFRARKALKQILLSSNFSKP